MLYPAIDPYEEGLLDTSDGQSIFWEQSGCPDGAPVVVLHGGLGSGCSPAMQAHTAQQQHKTRHSLKTK